MEERAKEKDILIKESFEVNLSQALGDGTEDNPFIISDADALSSIRNNLSAFYRLASDIDLNGETIVPIGTPLLPFTGGFDGDGHAIKNFQISVSSYAGLFGYAKSAKLKNLGMENGEVKLSSSGNYVGTLAGCLEGCITENIWLVNLIVSGNQYTGTLAGYVNGGRLAGCSVSGDGLVSGTLQVGGLVGASFNTTEVKECCSEVSVTGSSRVGGLIGDAGGAAISDSFATGSVTSTTGDSYSGGLVGYTNYATNIKNCYAACKVSQNGSGLVTVNASTTVANSYFDSIVAGFGTTNEYNVGKLTTALIRKGIFKTWDFENVWDFTEENTYPYLRSIGKTGAVVDAGAVAAGNGTEEDPYMVSSALGLGHIKYDLAGCYRLALDIDLNGETIAPIGTSVVPFTGGFDGDGHAIKNFKISASSYAGLFGYAKSAKLKNLGMESGEVKLSSLGAYVGTLAGYLDGCTTENIRLVNLTVSGNQQAGTLAGCVNGGRLAGCSVSGNGLVSGTLQIGGLVGASFNTTEVKECCSEVSVTGSSYVGGLIGDARGVAISDSYATGIVTSTTGNSYTGGLAGYTTSATSIKNCYASCRVSKNSSGLAFGSPTVTNSYFDSILAGITTPVAQARTTDQMLSEETYSGWNWENIWNHKENFYPILRNIEVINQEPFELIYRNLTYFSVVIEWLDIPGAREYNISYLNKTENLSIPGVHIKNLSPDTDYEFRVRAKIGDTIRVWSKTLRIKTKKELSIDGLHSVGKDLNSITLTWNQVEDAEGYEVIYNNSVQRTSTNKCTITGLYAETSYVIYVRALFTDGSTITSNLIVEKIYYLDAKTDYAREFIGKCEDQTWFVDEIENLLNLKGKSINTINSRKDFVSIYALGLAERGVSGRIPAAIGELFELVYLYLANNDLSGNLPEEIELLDKLMEMDLSGNHFSD